MLKISIFILDVDLCQDVTDMQAHSKIWLKYNVFVQPEPISIKQFDALSSLLSVPTSLYSVFVEKIFLYGVSDKNHYSNCFRIQYYVV